MDYSLKFDSDELRKRGVALDELTGEALGKVIVESLNSTINDAYDLARNSMTAGINLTDDYLRRKMPITLATAAKPQATIVAEGTTTTLSHFDKQQHITDVNWSNAQIKAMGKKFGPWPGWTKRRGNAKLGIPENRKSAGQSVAVSRGARSQFDHAFSIPGKSDNSGNLLMFTRRPGGSGTRALLGPAVYQLFKYQLNGTLLDETEEALAKTLADQVEAAMQKALSE